MDGWQYLYVTLNTYMGRQKRNENRNMQLYTPHYKSKQHTKTYILNANKALTSKENIWR